MNSGELPGADPHVGDRRGAGAAHQAGQVGGGARREVVELSDDLGPDWRHWAGRNIITVEVARELTYNLQTDGGGDGLHQLTVGGGAGDVAGLVPAGDPADDQGAPHLPAGLVNVQPGSGQRHGVLPPDNGGCGVPALGGAVQPHLPPLPHRPRHLLHLLPSRAVDQGLAGPRWEEKNIRNFSRH